MTIDRISRKKPGCRTPPLITRIVPRFSTRNSRLVPSRAFVTWVSGLSPLTARVRAIENVAPDAVSGPPTAPSKAATAMTSETMSREGRRMWVRMRPSLRHTRQSVGCRLPLGCSPQVVHAARGTTPFVLGQEPLAQPDRCRRDLDQLVLGDEFERALEGHRPWRREPQRLVVGVRPDVGELLLLGRVDVHVARAAVLADDHALVHLDTCADEQIRTLLQIEQPVRV